MKCCSSFIELIRGNSTKCDLATNTNNSSKRQSTKMSFTLQRDRENWVQIDGDLIDRSTGWLVGGLTCSLASMSIKISWGPIDLHKIAHCQTISLRIRSHLDKCAKSRAFFLLIFFPSHFCRRRSHQFLLLFINSFTTTPFFFMLVSELKSELWLWLAVTLQLCVYLFGGTASFSYLTFYPGSIVFPWAPAFAWVSHLFSWFNGRRCQRGSADLTYDLCKFPSFEHSVL